MQSIAFYSGGTETSVPDHNHVKDAAINWGVFLQVYRCLDAAVASNLFTRFHILSVFILSINHVGVKQV